MGLSAKSYGDRALAESKWQEIARKTKLTSMQVPNYTKEHEFQSNHYVAEDSEVAVIMERKHWLTPNSKQA